MEDPRDIRKLTVADMWLLVKVQLHACCSISDHEMLSALPAYFRRRQATAGNRGESAVEYFWGSFGISHDGKPQKVHSGSLGY